MIEPTGGYFRYFTENSPFLVSETGVPLIEGRGVIEVGHVWAICFVFGEAFAFGEGPQGFGGGLIYV